MASRWTTYANTHVYSTVQLLCLAEAATPMVVANGTPTYANPEPASQRGEGAEDTCKQRTARTR